MLKTGKKMSWPVENVYFHYLLTVCDLGHCYGSEVLGLSLEDDWLGLRRLHALCFDPQSRLLLLGRSKSKGAHPLMPGAGLPVDELAAAAPHAVHFLLQTAPVPEICYQSLVFWCQIVLSNIHKSPGMEMFWRWSKSPPWENVSVRIELLGHPCNLLEVGVRAELVREELLPVELLVELKPAIHMFVRQCLSMVGTKSPFLISITWVSQPICGVRYRSDNLILLHPPKVVSHLSPNLKKISDYTKQQQQQEQQQH